MADLNSKVKGVLNTKDTSKDYKKEDVEKNKGMAILAYFLFFVPLLTGDHKKSPYVKYHTNQATLLWIVAVGYSILYSVLSSVIKVNGDCGYGYWGSWASSLGVTCKVTPWWVTLPLGLIGLVVTAVAVLGIVNAAKGKTKELPVIGKYNIIK